MKKKEFLYIVKTFKKCKNMIKYLFIYFLLKFEDKYNNGIRRKREGYKLKSIIEYIFKNKRICKRIHKNL